MPDVSNFDRIKITLASPEQMRAWSHGEVKKAETINYRSQKPEKDGLFCERIFGPTKDYACACGKYHNSRRWGGIKCERCGVEVTESAVRRERMGHIELAAPVAHVWYSQGVAKHMSTLLDLKYKDLERVLNFTSPIITTVDAERRAEDMEMLQEELDESLDEFARERDAEKAAIREQRNYSIAVVLREHELETPLDEIQMAIWLARTTSEANNLKTRKSVADRAADPDSPAAKELGELVAAIKAEWAEALNLLDKLRAGDLDLDRLSQDYGVHPELSTGDRIARILKVSNMELRDAEDDYTERRAVREAAFEMFKQLEVGQILDDEVSFREMYRLYGPQVSDSGKVRDPGYFTGGMGAEHIRTLLTAIDLDAMRAELRAELSRLKQNNVSNASQAVKKIVKRLSVVDALAQSEVSPGWMVLDVIPVMPPELRPMVQLDGGRYATSDLNDLYRRVINRNNRLKKLLDLGAPDMIVNNEKRILQEAVDKLFDNRRDDRRTATGPSGRALKSLSHSLNGKQGRFRQNLLGKRVDYSGRSVIVGGPELKLHQCGLPKKMALELFKPFVMRRLLEMHRETNGRDGAPTAKQARIWVERQRTIVWDVLEEVIENHPVLLNRAPTLHRLGIQAFEPLLVEGKAIQLHPLVCAAFNADFDGDQMAVHVPLSPEAQAEARILMLSTNNIKSPSNGRPLTTPSQDMVLGLYHLTTVSEDAEGTGRAFYSEDEAKLAYDNRAGLDLRAVIEVRTPIDREVVQEPGVEPVVIPAGKRFKTTVGRILFNWSIPVDYPYINYQLDKSRVGSIVEDLADRYSTTEMGEILDEIKRLGFHYATHAGLTVSVFDADIPGNKWEILEQYEAQAAAIKEQAEMGVLTPQERHRHTISVWRSANEAVGDAMIEQFDQKNPIYMMAKSGARGNFKQIRQLAGMRGLMQSPKGDVIDRPIKTNFREGLTVLEYFISTHGARKGLADTALGTETGGYTTRRFLDFVHDAIVRTEDCGTTEGVQMPLLADHSCELDRNLIGRTVAAPVVAKSGEVLLDANEYIESMDALKNFAAAGVDSVTMRSALTCLEGRSVCQKCYGWDLSTGKPVDVGTAVGVIAAQSIGEPGTQLTMRTFHTGGVEGEDITQGLPLVNEILESPRANRTFADLAGADGTVSIEHKVVAGATGELVIEHSRADRSVVFLIKDKSGKTLWSHDPIKETDVVITAEDGKQVKEGAHIADRKKVRVAIEREGAEGKTVVAWAVDIDPEATLTVADGDTIAAGQPLTKDRPYGPDLLKIIGRERMMRYIIGELQAVYRGQGVELNDKHFEVIASRMLSKVKIVYSGDTNFLIGSYADRLEFNRENARILAEGGEPAQAEQTLIGPLQIVRASMRSLGTESFLSLASFMWTTTVLAQAALESREDELVGLKENVIIGKLIPAGTGMKRYRNVGVAYRGTEVTDARDASAAPSMLRDEIERLRAAMPTDARSLVDDPSIWTNFADEDVDVQAYLNVTFDPNIPLGGSEHELSEEERAEMIGGDSTEDAALSALSEMLRNSMASDEAPVLDAPEKDPAAMTLTDIGVSLRWVKKFAESGLVTVGDISGMSESALEALPGIGASAVKEVQEGLQANGIEPLPQI